MNSPPEINHLPWAPIPSTGKAFQGQCLCHIAGSEVMDNFSAPPSLYSAERSETKQCSKCRFLGIARLQDICRNQSDAALGFMLKGNVSISEVPMNQDLCVCVFFNREEKATHLSSGCICSRKPQQPRDENVFFVDFGQSTELQLVPARAQVCSLAAVSLSQQQHQGWQDARQGQQGWTDQLPRSPRACSGQCHGGPAQNCSSDVQEHIWNSSGFQFCRRRLGLHSGVHGASHSSWPCWKLQSSSGKLCQSSVLGAGGQPHSHLPPPNQEHLDRRLWGLFHLCLMQGVWKSFNASAELQILMFLVLGNLHEKTVPNKLFRKSELFIWVRNHSGIWRKGVNKSVRVFHMQLNPNFVPGKF